MLGHRAALLVAIPLVAAFGGGVALAAGQGSSHSSKPQLVANTKSAPKTKPMNGHNCPHMGSSSSTAPTSAGL